MHVPTGMEYKSMEVNLRESGHISNTGLSFSFCLLFFLSLKEFLISVLLINWASYFFIAGMSYVL